MTEQGAQILEALQEVAAERAVRARDSALQARVAAVKRFQHARFEAAYADMLAHPRYAMAARFFLEDLYGPADFAGRDDQFARIVPAMVRLFPRDIVGTVLDLARLHALSEHLDTAMAAALQGDSRNAGLPASLTAEAYGRAWRQVGQPDQRERQIALALSLGSALDRYTRNPLLRHTLRAMRLPAQASGLGALQAFLEKGFDSFRAMGGAAEFLGTVGERERLVAARLFAGADGA